MKIGSREMKQAARTAQAILELYDNGKVRWAKGTAGTVEEGWMCLLGAEHYVTTGNPHGYEYPPGSTPFRRCFKSRLYQSGHAPVWRFNDAKGRTYKHVRAALLRIIAAGKL